MIRKLGRLELAMVDSAMLLSQVEVSIATGTVGNTLLFLLYKILLLSKYYYTPSCNVTQSDAYCLVLEVLAEDNFSIVLAHERLQLERSMLLTSRN